MIKLIIKKALYDKGDPVSLEKVKDIIRSELHMGVINPQK
jgi:hypothetical protein